MKSTVAAFLLLIGCAVGGCAQRLPATTTAHSVARAVPFAPWSGSVRIAMNDLAAFDVSGSEREAVAALVGQLLEGLNVQASVICTKVEAGESVRGAIHARVRVVFGPTVTDPQHADAMNLLAALAPTQEAYGEYLTAKSRALSKDDAPAPSLAAR